MLHLCICECSSISASWSWCIIFFTCLYSVYNYFIEHFLIYVQQVYWPVVFSLLLSLLWNWFHRSLWVFLLVFCCVFVCLSVLNNLEGLTVDLLWTSGKIILWIHLALDFFLIRRLFIAILFYSFFMGLLRLLTTSWCNFVGWLSIKSHPFLLGFPA